MSPADGKAVTWIGLRSGDQRVWAPHGLGRMPPDGRPQPLSGVLEQGALVVEFIVPPRDRRTNLIRHAARDPWPAHLSVTLDTDGTLAVNQGWQGDSRAWHLHIPRLTEGETVIATLQWFGPEGTGLLSAWLPDRPRLIVAPAAPPLPLHALDAARIVAGPACRIAGDVAFVALSDRTVPIGPQGGLGPQTRVQTPAGRVAVDALRPGDRVTLAEGGTARILWSGTQRLPAQGRFRPFLIRAPFLGVDEDVILSADQRLRLTGSDIEYLFGTETVAVAARQMADQRRVILTASPPTVRYRQLLLDRPGRLLIGRTGFDPFDPGLLGHDPVLVALAGPGRAGVSAWPTDDSCPRLQDYEATTLRRMRAA